MTWHDDATNPRTHAATNGRRVRVRVGGFTLAELLIVIGIIVLVAILAVPAFRTMTGSRSTEAAQNQLAGILGRARAEAIQLQEVHGVAFFFDRDRTRVQAVLVSQTKPPIVPVTPIPATAGLPDIYLDLTPDRDPLLLPSGVGLQVVDNCNVANAPGAARGDDGYLGFNKGTQNGAEVEYGGVILFDAFGRLISKRYAFKCYVEVPNTGPAGGFRKKLSNFGTVYEMTESQMMTDFAIPSSPTSAVGFVIYDEKAFSELNYSIGDPQIDNTIDGGTYNAASLEFQEEVWIDQNAVPVLVNRNNGTLVKGE